MVTIGRKGLYDEWLTDDGLMRIEGWARDGLTNDQIAHNMGIGLRTLAEWLTKFPAISAHLKRGKEPVDLEVENALLKRALGYSYEEVTTEIEELPSGKQKKHIKKTTKTVVPDVAAQIYWLKNRRPDKWRDKPVDSGDTATMEKLDAMLAEVRNHASNA